MNLRVTISILVLGLAFCAVYVECGGAKHDVPCPDVFCKCFPKSKLANCSGSAMHFIPEFPSYVRNVIFTKTNFPEITRTFLLNLTSIRLEILSFIDTLTVKVESDAFVNFPKLTHIEISKNPTLPPGDISPLLLQTPTLRTVMLTSNEWKSIPESMFQGLGNSSIETIHLSGNVITRISGQYFSDLPFLRKLILDNNHLSYFNSSGMEFTKIIFLSLFNNFMTEVPSFCGPAGEETGQYKILNLGKNIITFMDEASFRCLNHLQNLILDQNVLPVLRNNTFVQLPKLESLSLNYIGDHLQTIEASAFNSSSLKKVYFMHNRYKFVQLARLYSSLFSSLPNLLSLDMTGNFLPEDALRAMFSPLPKLQKLILQNTHIKYIPRNFLQHMPSLRSIILIGNYISGWNDDPEVFGNVTSLRKLYLDGNNIKVINKTSFPEHFLNSLDSFCITNNPFSCTCDLMWFLDWMKSTKHTVIVNYPRRYVCRSPPEMNNVMLKDYNPTPEMCTHVPYILIRNVCIGTFVPLLLIIFVVSFGYKFRFQLRYWGHILGIKRVGYRRVDNDAEYQYDGFVIYSSDNRNFVMDNLIPELEGKGGCRLCIHERDFETGRYIMDNITTSFELSKNIILVMSKAFLDSEWCGYELALTQSRTVREGPGVLTVIMLDDLKGVMLSSSVHAILDTVTYIEWSEDASMQQIFWGKLMTALNKHADIID